MNYEVIVVGGGHAGCEAAVASARKGHKTLLISGRINNIATMPCNPSIGGSAKGIIVREIAGTAWGAYNSISGYYSNVDTATGTKRMDSIMFGDKSRKLKEALEYEFAI